jgi:hypothetical protein
VTTLLKGKGIDLDNNRFLILQGEVEQISLMRPRSEPDGPGGKDGAPGLLEYLEDIIGTDALVPRIEEEGKRCACCCCVAGRCLLVRLPVLPRILDGLGCDCTAGGIHASFKTSSVSPLLKQPAPPPPTQPNQTGSRR